MTRSRLILAIRVCLLGSLAILLGVPWWIVGPVALLPTVFGGITTCATICSTEPTVPGGVSVTYMGVANGSCSDCSIMNRTIVSSSHSPCTFGSADVTHLVCTGSFTINFQAGFGTLAGNTYHEVIPQINAAVGAARTVVTIGAAPQDCSGLTLNGVLSSHTNNGCNFDSFSTTTVTS